MSERVCLIERDERGDRVRAVRLIGQHAEAAWTSPRVDGRYASDAAEDAQAAAEWIANRLSVDGDKLGMLVVDTVGAHCAWVQAATADAGAVRSAFGHGGDAPLDEFEADLGLDDEHEDTDVLGSRPTPIEAAIEPLGPAYDSDTGLRVGVMVAPDAIVRLLIDALDEQGVDFTGVTSLWHVLGWTASPDALDSAASSRVVADSPTVIGGVLVQPDGRLIWSWCRDGAVLAAGSQRVALHDDGPIVTRHDVARLVNDWVSWSAQVGVAPGRILVVACPLAWEKSTGDPESLTAPSMASSISDLWPDAVLDIDVQDDPVLALLRRAETLAGDTLEPGHAMASLATRPGRSLRRGYQLMGLAFAALGFALAAIGWRWQSQVEGVREDAARVEQAYLADITNVENELGKPGEITGAMVPILKLNSEVDQATRGSEIDRPEGKPMLTELEGLSFLLSELGDRVELQDIKMGAAAVTVTMATDDASVVGEINAKLIELDLNGGALRWRTNSTGTGSRYTVRMIGTWQSQEGER
ncbi:MAG: hypothetical protein NCW75_04585 [Phycisphaera sp.]|nr:MAG: hypothetical protein NCW75_04585 [Phycisphaera sp.]